MKFGDTLYQRSVPKWAAYNLNYNELKHLIKVRTSEGIAVPLAIPGQSTNKWAHLEDDLFHILQQQYNNIALFIRSKHGEIERRLTYLEKQVQSARKSAGLRSNRSSVGARKYQRLVQETDDIGEDIQNLTRFAATQKTAFRKILKKYKKWTGSTCLQARIEEELFSDGQLQINCASHMQRLAEQVIIITTQLERPMLRGLPNDNTPDTYLGSNKSSESAVSRINQAATSSDLEFDAAFSIVPPGKVAGSAVYWIHPDNLEEAKVLLLRYSHLLPSPSGATGPSPALSRRSSTSVEGKGLPTMHTVFCDNVHRFIKDSSATCASRIALSTSWSTQSDAVVTMSNLDPRSPELSMFAVRRKDLSPLLYRGNLKTNKEHAQNARAVQDFLVQHRDIKPLAACHSTRQRFEGTSNSMEVGTWAILDEDMVFSSVDSKDVGLPEYGLDSGEVFPYAVLRIRWEFGRRPEVARAFDTTHLAEKVQDFSLENAAIYSQFPDLSLPTWNNLLGKDIRKLPITSRLSSGQQDSGCAATSGPSSTGDSVFSGPRRMSTTGSETSPTVSTRDLSNTLSSQNYKASGKQPCRPKKKARISARSPTRNEARYYSEYDDPNSEFNQEDAYVIFVDPNQRPLGAETWDAISGMFTSPFRGASNLVSSMLQGPVQNDKSAPHERTSLLKGRRKPRAEDDDSDSTDSDAVGGVSPRTRGRTNARRVQQHMEKKLSRRQRAHVRILQQISAALSGLGYILLLMSGVILGTGRRKEVLEVDVGAVIGIVAALLSGAGSLLLAFMRAAKPSNLETGILCVSMAGIVVLSVGFLTVVIGKATR